jgi:hypothetical protein
MSRLGEISHPVRVSEIVQSSADLGDAFRYAGIHSGAVDVFKRRHRVIDDDSSPHAQVLGGPRRARPRLKFRMDELSTTRLAQTRVIS